MTEMHFVLTILEAMNVLAKETTSGMEYHVSVCIIVHCVVFFFVRIIFPIQIRMSVM